MSMTLIKKILLEKERTLNKRVYLISKQGSKFKLQYDNCKNCGAPKKIMKCCYCGTINTSCKVVEK